MRDIFLPAVYILTNRQRGVLYIGVTSNPAQRIWQHRQAAIDGFAKRYRLRQLVLLERFDDMANAIGREKQLKRWHRDWKINLIEKGNSQWRDLAPELFGFDPL